MHLPTVATHRLCEWSQDLTFSVSKFVVSMIFDPSNELSQPQSHFAACRCGVGDWRKKLVNRPPDSDAAYVHTKDGEVAIFSFLAVIHTNTQSCKLPPYSNSGSFTDVSGTASTKKV